MGPGIDAKHLIHLPRWAKLLCLTVLAIGIATSLAVVALFFGSAESRDWVLIGVTGAQFLVTTFVVAVILFESQTDATIETLRKRGEHFLTVVLPTALNRITDVDDRAGALVCKVGKDVDIFGRDFLLCRGDKPVLWLWCGLNVHRLIVIYRLVNPNPALDLDRFAVRARELLGFTLGGAESVKYNVHVEPIPAKKTVISLWLTVAAEPGLLTDPAAKLFWSQDIAMMTESLLRTIGRHADEVRPDLTDRPHPL